MSVCPVCKNKHEITQYENTELMRYNRVNIRCGVCGRLYTITEYASNGIYDSKFDLNYTRPYLGDRIIFNSHYFPFL
jgi:uncharacterized CHY-type Zn-finger protein